MPDKVVEGSTLLFIAAMRGHSLIVEKLLALGADADRATEDSLIPLDVVGLEGGSRVTGYSGGTTVGLPAMFGGITKLLLETIRPNKRALEKAIIAGDVETVAEFLKVVSPEGRYENGRTVFHINVKNRNKDESTSAKYNEILEMLLEKEKSDIDFQDNDGKTPLFVAVEGKWKNDIELLLLNEADITVHSKDNENVFHLIAKQGNDELLETMLDNITSGVK